jgi:hypothetical protein
MIMADEETVEQAHERGYIEGRRWSDLERLREVLRSHHGFETEPAALEVQLARLVAERAETNIRLRQLARHIGQPDDWPETLNLADVVDKRIERFIEDEGPASDPTEEPYTPGPIQMIALFATYGAGLRSRDPIGAAAIDEAVRQVEHVLGHTAGQKE